MTDLQRLARDLLDHDDPSVRRLAGAALALVDVEPLPALSLVDAPPCPVCGRRFAVAARSGRFPPHGPVVDRCAGSGQPVVDEHLVDLGA